MSHAIKVRRHGLGITSNRKVPFRMWLNEQPRKKLTYREVDRQDENGWSTEDFSMEALKRGVNVRFFTALKWASGTMPREIRFSLEKAFPGIRFGK